jgi:putative oxidoreductase
MYVAFAVGRIALALFFILSGAGKFLDIAGTASTFQSKLAIPAELSDLTSQIEAATAMSIWQILVIVAAAIEVIGGLLIAFNVLTRTVALVLLVFVAVTTFYFHDFWNVTNAAERTNQMDHALKNLSIMGALLMLVAWPRRLMVAEVYAADRVDVYEAR